MDINGNFPYITFMLRHGKGCDSCWVPNPSICRKVCDGLNWHQCPVSNSDTGRLEWYRMVSLRLRMVQFRNVLGGRLEDASRNPF